MWHDEWECLGPEIERLEREMIDRMPTANECCRGLTDQIRDLTSKLEIAAALNGTLRAEIRRGFDYVENQDQKIKSLEADHSALITQYNALQTGYDMQAAEIRRLNERMVRGVDTTITGNQQ